MEAVCGNNMTTAESTGTTPAATMATTGQSTEAPVAAEEEISVAESVCIAVTSVTLVLHMVMIFLCAANLAVMSGIKKVLKSRTVMPTSPGIPSSSTFNLGPIGGRKVGSPMAPPGQYEEISSETPAEYEAVQPSLKPRALHKTAAEDRRLQFQDERGSQNSLNKANLSNSRTGSCEDLLDKGLK